MSDEPITTAQDATDTPQTPATQDAAPAFDAAYVEQLRKEAAKYRTQLRKYEAAQAEAEQAKLSELEKAQQRAAELENQYAATQMALRAERARNAIMAEAPAVNVSPKAAARLITADQLDYDDDGIPTKKSVQAALKSLAEELPEITITTRSANPARGAQVTETDAQRRQRIYGGGVDPFDPAVAAQLGGGVINNTRG